MADLMLGAQLGQQDFPMSELRELWRYLDGHGIDWISLWDHLYEAPVIDGSHSHFEAVASLAALAADTRNARLGCLVFYVGFRNPGLLAKAAMTIDHISEGRFELGLGAGWNATEALAYGYDFPDVRSRLDMLEDATALIAALMSQQCTTHVGPHYRATSAMMQPPPVRGSIPIWIGGTGERRTLRIAARRADGWNAAYLSPEEFSRLNGVLDHHCETIGRNPSTIERSINVLFAVGVDEVDAAETTRRLAEDFGSTWERAAPGVLTGTPAMAAERILEYRAAGADLVNISLRAPIRREAVDAYLEMTVPEVRRESRPR